MLEHLLERAPERYEVTIFNAEPRVNYDRIMLSPVLSGEKDYEQIIIHGDGWYIKNGITLYKGHKVTKIDRAAKTVTSEHGVTETLRQAGHRHGLGAVHSARTRQQPAGRPLLPRSRRRERDARRRAVARQGRRHRRRPARPRGGGRPQGARHGRHRPASDADADGAPARSGGGLHAAAGAGSARHQDHHQGARPRRSSASTATEGVMLADGRVDPGHAGRSWPPASGPTPPSPKTPGSTINRGILVDDGHAHLRSRTSSRSASAPRSAAMSTASSRRSTRWRASPPRTSPATTARRSSTTTRRPS